MNYIELLPSSLTGQTEYNETYFGKLDDIENSILDGVKMNSFVKEFNLSLEEINEMVRGHALSGKLVNQINYQIDPELVSTDIIGNACCSVFDSQATICTNDGNDVVLYVWYDNEFGYTKQVIRLAKQISKVRRLTYY